jgi:hypothetical protein
MVKEIIDSRCSCLGFGDCLKRTFIFHDIWQNKGYKYKICNEHFRLKLHELCEINKSSHYQYYIQYALLELVKIHIEIYDYWLHFNVKELKPSEITINFKFCERPYITRNITLKKAIEMYLENNLTDQAKEHLINAISSIFTKDYYSFGINGFHKKLLIGKDRFKHLIKKVATSYNEEEKELYINELFIFILNHKTKNQSK